MESLVVEGIGRGPEHAPVEVAAVESGVVLAGNVVDLRPLEPPGDLLKPLHPGRVLAGGLGVVGEVAREENDVRPGRESVDDLHRALERLRPQRAVPADVGVAELEDRERRRPLAVLPTELPRQLGSLGVAGEERSHRVERARAERDAGNRQELPPIHEAASPRASPEERPLHSARPGPGRRYSPARACPSTARRRAKCWNKMSLRPVWQVGDCPGVANGAHWPIRRTSSGSRRSSCRTSTPLTTLRAGSSGETPRPRTSPRKRCSGPIASSGAFAAATPAPGC